MSADEEKWLHEGHEFGKPRGIAPIDATFLSWPSRAGYVRGMGIYVLRCPDGRLYVGQATDLDARRNSHLTKLRAGKASPRLQAAYDETDEWEWEFLLVARLRLTRRFPWHEREPWLRALEARWCYELQPELNVQSVRWPWKLEERVEVEWR